MSFDVVKTTLAAPVATSGTIVLSYPTGRAAGDYTGGTDHKMSALGGSYDYPSKFTVAFSTSITVTYLGSTTLPAGTEVWFQFDRAGLDAGDEISFSDDRFSKLTPVLVNLGAPATADADGFAKTQAVTVGTTPLAVLDGDLVSGGVGVNPTPRNVVAAWTGTAVITVTGKDEYGNTVVESSASGTSFVGKKAFKTVTEVSLSANVTALTVGQGAVLGLPFFVSGTPYVIAQLGNGAAVTAGTVVAGVTTAPTATTGDVRGTIAPNTAPNGTVHQVVILTDDVSNLGLAQYAG